MCHTNLYFIIINRIVISLLFGIIFLRNLFKFFYSLLFSSLLFVNILSCSIFFLNGIFTYFVFHMIAVSLRNEKNLSDFLLESILSRPAYSSCLAKITRGNMGITTRTGCAYPFPDLEKVLTWPCCDPLRPVQCRQAIIAFSHKYSAD